jgi:hypothetical protein
VGSGDATGHRRHVANGHLGAERSRVRLALDSPEQMMSFRRALPELKPSDVIGSAYRIRRYEVDARFGGRDGLAGAYAALAQRGVRLLVDFVPNRVAPDHPRLTEHPEYFVQGTTDDLAGEPDGLLRAAGKVIAHGRDPHFKLPRRAVFTDVIPRNPTGRALKRLLREQFPLDAPGLIKELT